MNALVGTGALMRLALRRDRIVLPAWIVPLALLPAGVASSFEQLYPTMSSRQSFLGDVANNSALLALYGRIDSPSIGGLTMWRVGTTTALVVALATVLTVTRHTRAEEEAGRLELLGATVVGRHAALSASLIIVVGANLAVAVIAGLALMSVGLPVAGSFALGLALGSAGWTFAAIAGLTAQLTESARRANGLAVSVLGISFLVRAVADVNHDNGLSTLAWLSPIGWTERMRPYADERWGILALAVGTAVILTAATYRVSARRDLGAGVLPPQLGPATGSPRLRSPQALAVRLHRGALVGWTAGFVVMGLVLGAAADAAAEIVRDSEQMSDFIERLGGGRRLSDSFLAAIMSIFGLLAGAYGIQAGLRLRAEESAMRADPLLAAPVSRWRWMSSHLVFSVVGPAVALIAVGLGAGVAHGLTTGDVGRELPRVLAGAIVQLPAVWVVTGLVMALFGLVPRRAAVSWAALAVFALLGQFGEVLQLSHWALDVSPFTHVPELPGGDMSVVPLIWLLCLSVALTAGGVVAFQRRDVL